MLAVTGAIDLLRIANRATGVDMYSWTLVSRDGAPVQASSGISIAADRDLKSVQRDLMNGEQPDIAFVCGGLRVENHCFSELKDWLRGVARRGRGVGGLCTGAWVLGAAGLLDGKRCSIHWENIPGFSEWFPEAEVAPLLCEVDGNVYTSAGGTASLDLFLHIIEQDFDEETVTRVCEMSLVDRMRDIHDRQRLPLGARVGHHDSKLLSVVQLMESNLAEPIALEDISHRVGLSRRHVERLFRLYLGRSPARYYLEIRLDRARHLLRQTSLPVIEIAIACGFVSASHFSKCYRETYGCSPQSERARPKLGASKSARMAAS
ncbi:GlxA family transcriptional regulator [Tepidamorphus sp. 3E244]|uniref:GlxA family transcriptional regulator n=1 Tax=Tepidamorphus sp. 3E244 TaxID=3385498 RepID=UPI0038FC811A